jgi:hypothetical protein
VGYGALVIWHMVAETERTLTLRKAAQQGGHDVVASRRQTATAHRGRAHRRLTWGLATALRRFRVER